MNRSELQRRAEIEGIRSDAFSLDGGTQEDTYILGIESGGRSIYSYDRGERSDYEWFEPRTRPAPTSSCSSSGILGDR
jgi:hypothetical protein